MGFSIAKLTRWLLLAGVALAAAYPAEAQHQRQGQPILFSSTDNDNVSSNAPSLAAKPPGMMDLANAVQSPDLKFDNSSDNTQPPMPPPAISSAQAQQMQRQLDERNNWALSDPRANPWPAHERKNPRHPGSRRGRPAKERDDRGAILQKAGRVADPHEQRLFWRGGFGGASGLFGRPGAAGGFGRFVLRRQQVGQFGVGKSIFERDAGQPRRFRPWPGKRLVNARNADWPHAGAANRREPIFTVVPTAFVVQRHGENPFVWQPDYSSGIHRAGGGTAGGDSDGRVLHAVEQRHCDAGGSGAVAGTSWPNQRGGTAARTGMDTAAAAVGVVRAAVGRDSAAQILMRGSDQENLFES